MTGGYPDANAREDTPPLSERRVLATLEWISEPEQPHTRAPAVAAAHVRLWPPGPRGRLVPGRWRSRQTAIREPEAADALTALPEGGWRYALAGAVVELVPDRLHNPRSVCVRLHLGENAGPVTVRLYRLLEQTHYFAPQMFEEIAMSDAAPHAERELPIGYFRSVKLDFCTD